MSTIKVDKLQGRSGSTTGLTFSGANGTFGGTLAVTGVHTVGNNAINTSDGGAVTQNLVQGLGKAWVYATDAAVLTDSFNTASGTDNGTGYYIYAFTNAMASANYSAAGTTTDNTDQNMTIHSATTALYRVQLWNQAGNSVDRAHRTILHGDLA